MEIQEAIDILENIIADEVIGTYCVEIQKEDVNCSKNCEDKDCYLSEAISTIVNYIHKLQKENEDMREELQMYVDTDVMILQKELKDSINARFELQRRIDRLEKENEELKEEIDELAKENEKWIDSGIDYVKRHFKDYIHKDKIKAIVEKSYNDIDYFNRDIRKDLEDLLN